jgi:hypothetical protein
MIRYKCGASPIGSFHICEFTREFTAWRELGYLHGPFCISFCGVVP